MKVVVYLATAIAIGISAALPAAAEPVPERATGIWSIAECGGDGPTVLVDENAALVFETQGEETQIALARSDWLAGFVVLTMDGEAGELVLPPLDGLQRCAALPLGFSLVGPRGADRQLLALAARMMAGT